LVNEIWRGSIIYSAGSWKDMISQQTTPHCVAILLVTSLSIFILLKSFTGIFYETDPFENAWAFCTSFFSHESRRDIKVDNWINEYTILHDDKQTDVSKRETTYKTLVNAYYELATIFYEWGWGASFHFAYRQVKESFSESIRRHEYYLAGRLGISSGEKVLDVGCGIGGPYRNIAQFTKADITGITINEYQVWRANELNKQAGLSSQVRSIQGDFMELPFEAESFDGVYAIEATCHAPVREGVFGEIFRVLKPGRIFACYEWCLTDLYDKDNAEHCKIKKQIEEGDGLPDMCHTSEVVRALKATGFEVIETRDMALDSNVGGIPWYQPLTPSYNIFSQRWQFTATGQILTRVALRILEFMRLVPEGTNKVQRMLQHGAVGLSKGGSTKTFTPMFLAVVRKPVK
jgi:sterol 24-C-methyltransferase